MTLRSHARPVHLAVAAMLLLLLTSPSRAHNSGATHTEITDVAFNLMRAQDRNVNGAPAGNATPCVVNSRQVCSYEELWRHGGDLLPIPRLPQNMEDVAHDAYVAEFNAGVATGMMGVVVEDGIDWTTLPRVVNHFYHATTGIGLLDIFDSSYERAGELFEFGLMMHGYVARPQGLPADATSQDRSYIYMGRFLHHVEDMSSPAHVHNDAHVYGFGYEPDKDDYEGRYVPLEMWATPPYPLRGELETAVAPKVINSASDIWPVPQDPGTSPPNNTLAGFVFNKTTYYGILEFPTFFFPPANAAGELALMFPNMGVHWEMPPDEEARWIIDGVGPYWYVSSWADADTWWPDTDADGAINFDPDGDNYQYYIEQLMSGEDATTALQPPWLRADWTIPYADPGNPVVPNRKCEGGPDAGTACMVPGDCSSAVCKGKSFVELQADHLLAPAVEYTAGAAKFWYEVANLPPYLRSVEAIQDPTGAMDVKYTAEWSDVTETQTLDLLESGLLQDTHETVTVVASRFLSYTPSDRKWINALTNLTLRLDFNESIRQIDQLHLLDSGGALQKDVLAAVAAQGSNNVPTIEGTCRLDPDTVCSMDGDCAMGDRCLLDTRWTYTLDTMTLDGLNGELTLSVKAIDMNNHRANGEQLDETPQTPARRNLQRTCANDPSNECTTRAGCWLFADCRFNLRTSTPAQWHTDQTDPDFAYDFGNGDRTHKLLFDTEPPTGMITSTP